MCEGRDKGSDCAVMSYAGGVNGGKVGDEVVVVVRDVGHDGPWAVHHGNTWERSIR